MTPSRKYTLPLITRNSVVADVRVVKVLLVIRVLFRSSYNLSFFDSVLFTNELIYILFSLILEYTNLVSSYHNDNKRIYCINMHRHEIHCSHCLLSKNNAESSFACVKFISRSFFTIRRVRDTPTT